MSCRPLVVGVGASAGGLEAFGELLQSLGPNPGAALVFVQHLDHSSKELLAEVLAQFTRMPIVALTPGRHQLKVDTVTLCPPQTLLELQDGYLTVIPPRGEDKQPHVIDHFFHSMADALGGRGIGIILSGAGSDGTLGLKAISDRGGLTFAQDTTSAKYDSMPRSAATTGVADHILPPAEIAGELLNYVQHLQRLDQQTSPKRLHEEIENAIPRIAEILLKTTDHNFLHYKTNTLVRRVQRRMQVLKIGSASDYVNLLSQHEDEAQALFRELLIGVTSFFRDPEVFETLKAQVLPALFQQRTAVDSVRIWVAGCANGAEAYTVAMSCREVMDDLKTSRSVQIFATDIDERALSVGRAGAYPLGIEEQVSPERLKRFFVKRGQRYHVSQEIRELVLFSAHNLISAPPFSRQDLICCRNLLIYLGSHLQDKLIPLFHYALRPGGYLVLGPSENIASHAELFEPVDARLRISQRKGTATGGPTGMSFRAGLLAPPPGETSPDRAVDLTVMMQKIALDEFTPKTAVIDETGQILTSSANITKYLHFSGGQPQTNILKMADPGLRIGLRAAIAEAKRTLRRIDHPNLSVRDGEKIQPVMVTVQPMPSLGEDEELFLVVFQDVGLPMERDSSQLASTVDAHDADAIIAQMERELETTRRDLDKSLQDMEAANEELKSSNEELLSMNEELQSANEELETSKDELRSSAEAVARAHSDLENLLRSTQIATVFLDDQYCIRNFTPAIRELYSLIPSDIGRPLENFVPKTQRMPPLPTVEQAKQLFRNRHTSLENDFYAEDTIVSDSGKSFIRRVLPYQSPSGGFEGIVVTFTDVTELRRSQEQFQLLIDASAQTVWLTDAQGQVIEDSPSWREFTGQTFEQWQGSGWLDAIHPDDRDSTLAHWRAVVESGDPFLREYRLLHHSGSYRWTQARAVPQRRSDGSIDRWIGMNIDISERRQWENSLVEREQHLRNVIDSTGTFIGVLKPDGTVLEANELALMASGVTRDDVVGKPFWECVWWDFDPQVKQKIRDFCRRVAAGESIREDLLYALADGSVRPVDLSFNPIRDADGNVTHLIPSGIDILDRQTAEQELRRSEELVRTIAENSTQALVMMDDRGYVTYCNQVLLDMTGYDEDEIRSAPLHDLIHHHYPDGRPYPISQCPIDRALPEDFSVRAHEDLFFRKDGSTFEVLCAASPIFRDGRPVSTVIEVRDVTEQNAARRALIETQDRLDLSMEVSDTAAWNWNLLSGEVVPNENLHRLFGFDVQDRPKMRDFFTRIDSIDRRRILQAIQSGVAGEDDFEEEFRIQRPDGQVRWLRGRGRFVKTSGQDVEEFFGVLTDITGRKRAELDLAEAKRKLDLAMQVSGIAAWSVKVETNAVIGDETLNRLFGFSGAQSPPLDQFIERMHPEDRDRVSQAIMVAMADGSFYDQEYRVVLPDGNQRWLRAMGQSVPVAGGPLTEFTGVIYDVTERKLGEVELAAREAHLRRVINNQLGLVGVIDRQGILLEVDDRSLAIAHARRDEVIGKHFAASPWWNYDPAVEAKLRAAMQQAFSGEVVRYDVSLFADGDAGVMIDFMLAPVRNDKGQVDYLIASGVDIRERKAAELALEQRVRLAELHTSLAITLSSGETLETTLQAACQRFVGVLDVAFARVWLHDETEGILRLTASAGLYTHLDGEHARIAVGKFKIGRIAESRQPLLTNCVTSDPNISSPQWAEREGMQAFAGYPLEIAGRVVGVLGMFSRREITPVEFEQLGPMSIAIAQYIDRLQYAEQLAKTAQRTKMALRAGGMAAWEWTPEKSYWTPELYQLLGVSADRKASLELYLSAIHPDDVQSAQRDWQFAVDGNDRYYSEFRVQSTEGEQRWIVGLGEVVRDDAGNVIRIYGVNWDATYDRQQEVALRESERRATEASRSKSAFLANMSHEIRTPMTAILGYTELMRDRVDDPELQGYLQTIHRNGHYLLEIINDILDLSKIEAGKFEIIKEQFDPAQVVEDVRSIMEVRARETGLKLIVEYDQEIPNLVDGDPKRLKQILINLVGNAIKFTHQGSVTVRVRYYATALPKPPKNKRRQSKFPALQFEVVDTGIGMTEELLTKLFRSFEQGDSSVSRQFGGTGLGLVISQRLAELLGGTISVESKLGKGSTFTATVAVESVSGSKPIAPQSGGQRLESRTVSAPVRLSCRVLVVDDRRDIRFLSQRLLTQAGATVDEAEDGQVAVARISGCLGQRNCPDLILLDMQMPNLDGYQTARQLRGLGYTGPIIALTADAMQGDMNECLQAGCNDYLSKPIDSRRMIELVAKLTNQSVMDR